MRQEVGDVPPDGEEVLVQRQWQVSAGTRLATEDM